MRRLIYTGVRQTAADRLREIEHLLDGLTVGELRTVRVLAGKKQKAKLEDAKTAVLAEMEGKVKAMGLRLKDVFPSHNSSTKAPIRVKYRSPAGETWSGRGQTPKWLRALEEKGHTREEFLVTGG